MDMACPSLSRCNSRALESGGYLPVPRLGAHAWGYWVRWEGQNGEQGSRFQVKALPDNSRSPRPSGAWHLTGTHTQPCAHSSTCTHMHTHPCMHTQHMHTHSCTHMHTCTCARTTHMHTHHAHMHTHAPVHTHMHTHVPMHTHVRTHAHSHTRAHNLGTHDCTHTCTRVCTHSLSAQTCLCTHTQLLTQTL